MDTDQEAVADSPPRVVPTGESLWTLGIIVGGGPAPGTNAIIHAASLEALNRGLKVVGFTEGFRYLVEGRTDCTVNITVDLISRIHFVGGAILKTSRTNPAESEESLANCAAVMEKLNITHLLVIGGNGVIFATARLLDYIDAQPGEYTLNAMSVPKTIDNDVMLPAGVATCGFSTARDVGASIIKNLMFDAETMSRWFVEMCMGRDTGHLTQAIAKTAGAHLSIIPEEWIAKGRRPTFKEICDIIEGAIVRRLATGKGHGVCIIAEGLGRGMKAGVTKEDMATLFPDEEIEHDEFGNLRTDGFGGDFETSICKEVKRRLRARDIGVNLTGKSIGYELRGAPPNDSDLELGRDLGFGVVQFLLEGHTRGTVYLLGDDCVSIPFDDMVENSGEMPKVRYADVSTRSYKVAAAYQMRLTRREVDDPEMFAKMVKASKMTADEFRAHFADILE